jgi:uncharacterized metal-binding protein YceD (DUF177 family)
MSNSTAFSKPILVESIRKAGQHFLFEATAGEREAMAAELGILGVEAFNANLKLTRDGERVHMLGTWSSSVVQACGITLEPLTAKLQGEVDTRFAPPASEKPRREGDEETIMMDTDDPPEPVIEGHIDPGILLVEFLSLALDPYPRKAGAVFGEKSIGAIASPFAALAKLKGQ